MRISESSFEKLYKEQQESGLSVRDFCSNVAIAPSTFYRWKKILEEKELPGGFVPLLIGANKSDNDCTPPSPFVDVNRNFNNNSLEFTFPNGTKLHLKGNIDISLLKAIIHLY